MVYVPLHPLLPQTSVASPCGRKHRIKWDRKTIQLTIFLWELEISRGTPGKNYPFISWNQLLIPTGTFQVDRCLTILWHWVHWVMILARFNSIMTRYFIDFLGMSVLCFYHLSILEPMYVRKLLRNELIPPGRLVLLGHLGVIYSEKKHEKSPGLKKLLTLYNVVRPLSDVCWFINPMSATVIWCYIPINPNVHQVVRSRFSI